MHLAKRVVPYILITRPGICIGCVILVFLSVFAIDPYNLNVVKAVFAGVAVGLSAAAGSVINDVFDRNADIVNNPHRVLPGGTMSTRKAVAWYLFLLGFALLLFVNVNSSAFAGGVLANAALFLYSWKLRKTFWWASNFAIALLIAVMLSFGVFVAQEINERIAFLFFFWFLVALAREILGDITDMEGDRVDGMRTLPLVVGRTRSIWLVAVVLFVAATWSYTPFLINSFHHWVYGLGVSTIYVGSFCYVLSQLKKNSMRPVQDVLKAVLFLHPVLFAFSIFLSTN
jgi:geranylgeranylglycerol-phosphate geranylgeranyltransferase